MPQISIIGSRQKWKQGKQKDKCKFCSLQFTRLTPREKAMAVTVYTGLSIRAVARPIEAGTI